MPSRAPTSSFEHPAAIRATTSRCRGVIDDGLELMMAVMEGNLVSLDRVIHSPEGVTEGVFASDGAGEPVATAVRPADPPVAEPEDGLADTERMLHPRSVNDVAEPAQALLLVPHPGLEVHRVIFVDAPTW